MTRRTLRARLSLWIAFATSVSLVIFALIAYAVVRVQETSENPPDPDQEETAAENRNEVLIAMAFAAPVGLALAIGGAFLLSRRAMKPVDDTIRAASEFSGTALDKRLPVPPKDDEVRDLVVSLNGLLGRIEGRYHELERFAGAASHELRTPLAVICNELEVALRHPRESPEWEAIAKTSLDEMQRLSKLVDALLRLARASSLAASEVIDLSAMVDQVVGAHSRAARDAGIALVLDGEEVAASCVGDPTSLASAVSNVIVNAVMYTPRGGTVTVKLDGDERRTEIIVEDEGPGIADEEEEIFAPFVRGVAGRKAEESGQQGLGLGLAIARQIVVKHAGMITAMNTGRGARFVIDLPRSS